MNNTSGEKGMQHYRQVQDRRRQLTHPWFNLHGLRGRRQNHRREIDKQNPAMALDWHHPHLLFVTLATLVLCFADAHNTMQLIWKGAVEINHFMDLLIREDSALFMAVKMALTGISLVILVSYHHVTLFNLIRIRHVIYSIFAMYVGLIGYEIYIWPGTDTVFIFLPI